MIIMMIINYDHYHIHDDYDDHDDSIEIIGCNLWWQPPAAATKLVSASSSKPILMIIIRIPNCLPTWLIIKTHFSLASPFNRGKYVLFFCLFSCTVGIDVSQEVALAHFKRLSICHPLQCLLSISVLVRLDIHQIVCYHYFDQWSSPTIRGQRSEWSSWWPWSCPWPWCKWQKRWTDPQCLLPLPPSSCKNRFYARQGKNAMFCCTTREDSDDFEFSKLFLIGFIFYLKIL